MLRMEAWATGISCGAVHEYHLQSRTSSSEALQYLNYSKSTCGYFTQWNEYNIESL